MDDNSLSWPSEDRIDTISKLLKSLSLEDLLESKNHIEHTQERMKLFEAQRYIDAVLQEIISEARSFGRKKFQKMLLKNTPICALSQSSLIKIRKATEITNEACNNLQQNNVYPTNHIINKAYPVTHITEDLLQTDNPYVSRDLMKHLVDLKDMIVDITTELKSEKSKDFYAALAERNDILDQTENRFEDYFIVQSEIPKKKKGGKFRRFRKKVKNSFKRNRKTRTPVLEEIASKTDDHTNRNEASPILFRGKKTYDYERNTDKLLELEREIIEDHNNYSKKYSTRKVNIESMEMGVNNYVQGPQQETNFTNSTTQEVKKTDILESMNIPIYRKKVESAYNKDDVIINYQFTKFDKIEKPTSYNRNFQVLTVDVAQSLPSEKSIQVITISSLDLLSIQSEI